MSTVGKSASEISTTEKFGGKIITMEYYHHAKFVQFIYCFKAEVDWKHIST